MAKSKRLSQRDRAHWRRIARAWAEGPSYLCEAVEEYYWDWPRVTTDLIRRLKTQLVTYQPFDTGVADPWWPSTPAGHQTRRRVLRRLTQGYLGPLPPARPARRKGSRP